MNHARIILSWLFIICLLSVFFVPAFADGEDAGYIYGNPPTNGKILLKLVNNEDSLDAVAVITKGGDKTPLLAIYIPSEEVGSIKKMPSGRYDVYFTTGIDWNEDRFKFNDGRYYKFKSPLILGEKTEYTMQLYADPGNLGTRIKHIDSSIFPTLHGASSFSDSGDPVENTWSTDDKPVSAPPKK